MEKLNADLTLLRKAFNDRISYALALAAYDLSAHI